MNKNIKGLLAVALIMVCSFALIGCGVDPMDAKLTQDNFNEIVVNTTTYEEVIDILGQPTSDNELTNGAGTLVWKNKKDTKSITLVFANNIVATKTQTGIL